LPCRQQCQIDHPAGTGSEVSALSACLVSHCENDCGLTCGALAAWAVEPDAAKATQSCMTSSSCAQMRACASSANCDAVNRCRSGCPTLDCISTCIESHGVDLAWCASDAGETEATSVTAAFLKAASACASVAGNNWECAGHVSWPAPKAASTTIQDRIVEAVTAETLAGMEVEACDAMDMDCINPWVVGYTNALGWFSLQVPLLPVNSTAGYLKVTMDPGGPGESVRAYFNWGFPLTQGRLVFPSCATDSQYIGYFGPADMQSVEQMVDTAIDGGMPDPTRGEVVVGVTDCLGQLAPGVQVTLSTADARTAAFSTSLAPSAAVTDSKGLVVFVRVPAGPLTVTAIPPAIGKPSGMVTVTVRAGADFPENLIVLPPTPL
jgi:hypothetical protein